MPNATANGIPVTLHLMPDWEYIESYPPWSKGHASHKVMNNLEIWLTSEEPLIELDNQPVRLHFGDRTVNVEGHWDGDKLLCAMLPGSSAADFGY